MTMINNTEVFKKYASSFDVNVKAIKMKLEHSLKVADVAKKIAEDVFEGNAEYCEVAYNAGLLHDVARFYQWKTYETFNDFNSIDHGDYGVEILFGKGEGKNQIKNYNIAKKWYGYLFLAIKFHNKLAIDDEFVGEYCKKEKMDFDLAVTLCKITRDADKVDITRVVGEGESAVSVPKNIDLSLKGYSKEIIGAFNNRTSCDFQYRKTVLDYAIGYMAFLFELYYDISKTLVQPYLNGYLSVISKIYGTCLDIEDLKILKKLCNEVKKEIKK